MNINIRHAAALLPVFLGGCVSTAHIQPSVDTQRVQSIVQAPPGQQRDRQAILAMVGEYKVTFAFNEHDPAPGYTPTQPYRSGAFEMVVVAEETGNRIVLQHMLVNPVAGFVIKHWRQDWKYQASQRLEFTEAQTWRLRPIPAEKTQGAWTQCVYEVSDAPRYCGTGKWTYENGSPAWTSDADWRPLPRREYTKRDDYNVLGIVNTHRITPEGWRHEQDNRKVVREGEKEVRTVVHETGVNDYRRITGYNFNTGYWYWQDTAGYWKKIRTEWQRRIKQNQGLRLDYAVDSMDMIWPMYWQSEQAHHGAQIGDAAIRKLFDPWVKAP